MFSTVDEIKFSIEPQINPYRGPLFITRSLESPVGDNIITNGGFGLVDTGREKLLVTCQHVWKNFQEEHSQDSNFRMCVCLDQHGPVVFDQNEPIDHSKSLYNAPTAPTTCITTEMRSIAFWIRPSTAGVIPMRTACEFKRPSPASNVRDWLSNKRSSRQRQITSH